MDVPDPALAQDVADALSGLAEATEQAGWDLAGVLVGLRLHWQGHAARAAEQLVGALTSSTGQTSDQVRAAATTWTGFAADLRGVKAKVALVQAGSDVAVAWGVFSVLQAGLDPATDAAALASEAAAQGILATARRLLDEAMARVVARSIADRAALRALAKVYVRSSIIGAATSALSAAAIEQFEYGHVHAADVLTPSLALALLPGSLQKVQATTGFDPFIAQPKPACFADRATYLKALDAADGWAADSGGALVGLTAAAGGGVRLTVHGGDIAERVGGRSQRPPGRAYTAAELRPLDPSAADLLEELQVWAPDAPATAVLS